MERAEKGKAKFTRGFNCAQSVFSSLAEGSKISESQALRIAGPFGGGVADSGKMCGAVSGALMALGLLEGTDDLYDQATRSALQDKAARFLNKFEKEFGSLECDRLREFLPDPSDPHTYCQRYVGRAIELVQEMLQ